ncbi:hypothetical protein Hanom_Chr15g01398151 [Helianthus anomalus]
MVSANGGLNLERKRAIVTALCKSRSLDVLSFNSTFLLIHFKSVKSYILYMGCHGQT